MVNAEGLKEAKENSKILTNETSDGNSFRIMLKKNEEGCFTAFGISNLKIRPLQDSTLSAHGEMLRLLWLVRKMFSNRMEFIENKPFDDCIGTEKRTLFCNSYIICLITPTQAVTEFGRSSAIKPCKSLTTAQVCTKPGRRGEVCGEEQPGKEKFKKFPCWGQSCRTKMYNSLPKYTQMCQFPAMVRKMSF